MRAIQKIFFFFHRSKSILHKCLVIVIVSSSAWKILSKIFSHMFNSTHYNENPASSSTINSLKTKNSMIHVSVEHLIIYISERIWLLFIVFICRAHALHAFFMLHDLVPPNKEKKTVGMEAAVMKKCSVEKDIICNNSSIWLCVLFVSQYYIYYFRL